MIELKDTQKYMCSDDWRKRLIAEYAQCEIRAEHVSQAVKSAENCGEEIDPLWTKMGIINKQHADVCLERLRSVYPTETVNYIHRWVWLGVPLNIIDDCHGYDVNELTTVAEQLPICRVQTHFDGEQTYFTIAIGYDELQLTAGEVVALTYKYMHDQSNA